MSKLGTVKKRVKALLAKNAVLRDDYTKLILTYWALYDFPTTETPMSELYKMADSLTPTESITRASRNLQRDYEVLRGKRYGNTKEKETEYKQEFSHQ